jgi:hypothetical protein
MLINKTMYTKLSLGHSGPMCLARTATRMVTSACSLSLLTRDQSLSVCLAYCRFLRQCVFYMWNLMFRWPCIVVYQYNETNVIHFSLKLLRIKGPLHVSSITCSSLLAIVPQPTDIIRPINTPGRFKSAPWRWARNPRNM